MIQVHGPGAITSDGPCELCVAGGSLQLLSLDDETDGTAAVETLATLVVEENSSHEIVVRQDKTGWRENVPLNEWQEQHLDEMSSKVLHIPVDDFEPFNGDFWGRDQDNVRRQASNTLAEFPMASFVRLRKTWC